MPSKHASTSKTRSLRLTVDEWAAVDKLAAARGMTAHALVAAAVRQLVDEAPAAAAPARLDMEPLFEVGEHSRGECETFKRFGECPNCDEAGPDLVVIPCGGAKLDHAAPAAELYTGSYFHACQRTAQALRPRLGYLILSAKHGLVRPETVIEPYNQRMGAKGFASPETLVDQALRLGVYGARRVVILAGRDYANAARQVWPVSAWPLSGCRGIGEQLRTLKEIRDKAGA